MARFTINTPWGKADTYENLGQGVFVVTTSSHGGYFVPDCMLHNISPEGRAYAKHWSGSENWYEEDCAWAYVAAGLPSYFPAEAQEQAKKVMEWIAAKKGLTV